jgi:hypothetical protein
MLSSSENRDKKRKYGEAFPNE